MIAARSIDYSRALYRMLEPAIVKPKYSNIDNEELKDLLSKGVKIIDVRHPFEWKETGVVKGSILIESFEQSGKLRRAFITELAETVKKDEPFIMICRYNAHILLTYTYHIMTTAVSI